ncbi:MAG: hypothetical protein A4S17_03950 [Proteobacteria bacterium HN_bin10]|nr:MAG: hypothetical protein A4S17_03950 [Proteobacteria bacterium HN_bin10]
MPQARGDAVHERLDADEAGRRVGDGLRHQMLAAAETDFEHYSPSPSRRGGRGRRGAQSIRRLRVGTPLLP